MADSNPAGLIFLIGLYYNEIVSSFWANKKLIFWAISLGVVVYFLGPDRISRFLNRPSVLGEEVGPVIEDKILTPAKETISRHVRWPQKEDLTPLPQLVGNEDQQKDESGSEDINFDQSLETLTENIKKLPQQQLIKVKEQLIKEVFPDCQCVCE